MERSPRQNKGWNATKRQTQDKNKMSQKPSKLRLEHLRTLEPMTKNQEIAFQSWQEGFNLVL